MSGSGLGYSMRPMDVQHYQGIAATNILLIPQLSVYFDVHKGVIDRSVEFEDLHCQYAPCRLLGLCAVSRLPTLYIVVFVKRTLT